jgi:trk system potassium uptake protein
MVDERVAVLTHAVRGRVLLKYLGQLALVLAILAILPLLVSLGHGEYAFSGRFLGIVLFLLGVFLLSCRLSAPAQLQANEAYAIVALTFCLSPLILSFGLSAIEAPYLDILFECISGVTTTGLSTLPDIAGQPRTFLFTRAYMQWFGGLGIVVFTIALLGDYHLATRRLLEGSEREGLASATRIYARRVVVVYGLLTAGGMLVLWLVLGNGFHALLLTLSAISTGGFAPFDDSLAGLTSPAAFAVLGLCVLGAVAIPVYLLLWLGNWRQALGDGELHGFLALVLGIGTLLFLLRWSLGHDPAMAARDALFLGLTAQTTAGFSTLAPAQLDDASQLLLVVAMFTGGGLGSTAGGIKILRLLILWRLLQLLLQRSALPEHAVVELRIGGRRLDEATLRRALAVIALFALLALLSWWLFLLAGHDPLPALFEVISALGTVGLSSGISQASLEPWFKGILMFNMLAGRLEILALLILLYPPTWLGRKPSP